MTESYSESDKSGIRDRGISNVTMNVTLHIIRRARTKIIDMGRHNVGDSNEA